MKSMTGYGKRNTVLKGFALSVEVRSVNHRFCEIVSRLPKGFGALEEDLKQLVRRSCERGRIELSVSLDGSTASSKELVLDRAVARRYYQLLKNLQQELHLGGTIEVGMVAGFRDVISLTERSVEEKDFKPILQRLAIGALGDLDKMRCREGKALQVDIINRLGRIRDILAVVHRRIPLAVQEYFGRMKERIRSLLGENQLDGGRLNQELAAYADRCDVTEELTRLDSHLAQFQAIVKGKGAMGRRLDFLLQEMGREVNTMGSKANDTAISLQIVEIKSELEKIREQVQNIE